MADNSKIAHLLDKVVVPDAVAEQLERADTTLLISHSAGKDSTAMLTVVMALHDREGWHCRVKVVHQDLGRMEWHETLPECERQAAAHHLDLIVQRHHEHDLLAGIERRMARRPEAPPFPSSAARYCTSSWKRDACSKWIRNNIADGEGCVVAMGLRADESSARAGKPTHQLRTGANAPRKNRTVYDWNPLLHFREADVWAVIGYSMQEIINLRLRVQSWRDKGAYGQALMSRVKALGLPFHPAYALGNERVSCAMCVLACRTDLANGAEFRPDTYQRLVEIEQESGFAFQQNKPLSEVFARNDRAPKQTALAL